MKWAIVAAIVLLGLFAAALWLGQSPRNEVVPTGDDPPPYPTSTPTRPFPDPILSAGTAIARSEAAFPTGHNPYSETARLVTYATAEAWLGYSGGSYASALPVWLVGMLEDELTVGEFLGFDDNSEPAAGAFYAWDSSNGMEILAGVLYSSGGRTLTSLASLPTASAAIASATFAGETLLATAVATPTYTMSEAATANYHLTAIAQQTATSTPTAPIP